MARCSLSEMILRLAAGRGRGAAIYGDLVEMAATRSNAWFWIAYTRTLLHLSWRVAAGFIAGITCLDLLDRATGGSAGFTLVLADMASPVLANIAASLLLVLPYVTVRYGLRDRMVWLAWLLFVPHAIAIFYVSPFFVFTLLVAILAVAFCIRTWRGPAAALIGAVAVGAAISACFPGTTGWDTFAVLTLPVMMLVCSGLRKRLLVSR